MHGIIFIYCIHVYIKTSQCTYCVLRGYIHIHSCICIISIHLGKTALLTNVMQLYMTKQIFKLHCVVNVADTVRSELYSFCKLLVPGTGIPLIINVKCVVHSLPSQFSRLPSQFGGERGSITPSNLWCDATSIRYCLRSAMHSAPIYPA